MSEAKLARREFFDKWTEDHPNVFGEEWFKKSRAAYAKYDPEGYSLMLDQERCAKENLDIRELAWFKQERGWCPPESADIDKWLMEMRERDEADAVEEALR